MIKKCFLLFLMVLAPLSCGPDTIFLRPGLDTPEQHVAAGHQLLERGKLEDAYREFCRARELNPRFVSAHVGVGLTLGRKGRLDAGLANMDRARQLAQTPQEMLEVQKGYKQLDEIKRDRNELLLQ